MPIQISDELAEWLRGKGYHLALILFSSLLTYAITALPLHYALGMDALASHRIGLFSMFGVFTLLFIIKGKKNNWFDLGKLISEEE